MDLLTQELARDEGLRLKPYRDGVGKLTIGYGRNLDDVGISPDEAQALLANDIAKVAKNLDGALPWWRTLDEVRQRVLANMAFNMGIMGLLSFVNTLTMIEAGDYGAAADNMLKGRWAMQVGPRAQRLADMMRDGGNQ